MMAPCGRDLCWTCNSGQPGKCLKKGLVYKIICSTCQEEGARTEYIGETSRSSFHRGWEHQVAIQKRSKESPLIEHWEEAHKNQEPRFSMKVEGYYQQPLYRQTREGQLISDYQGGTLLNRRGEWGQNLPPKLEIVVDDRIQPTKSKKSIPKRKKQAPGVPDPDTRPPVETSDTANT